MQLIIREMIPAEYLLLKEFTYQAIFQRPDAPLLSRDILEQPELKLFYEDFGQPDDVGFVAEVDKQIIGAAWSRILSGEIKGYGHVDSDTPELAISLYLDYRGQGIGTKLLKALLLHLKKLGYSQASLSVQKDNQAAALYRNIGFVPIEEKSEDYLMILDLNSL